MNAETVKTCLLMIIFVLQLTLKTVTFLSHSKKIEEMPLLRMLSVVTC